MNKDKVLADIVKAFFKHYTMGIAGLTADAPILPDTRQLKEIMLEHYEQIADDYNRELFYVLCVMNYKEDEMERRLRAFRTTKNQVSSMDYIRFACRTEAFFETMVEEYRRNFLCLLEGRLPSEQEHEENYSRNNLLGSMESEMAEELIRRISNRAYQAGRNRRKQ